jgi:hypothetical protein
VFLFPVTKNFLLEGIVLQRNAIADLSEQISSSYLFVLGFLTTCSHKPPRYIALNLAYYECRQETPSLLCVFSIFVKICYQKIMTNFCMNLKQHKWKVKSILNYDFHRTDIFLSCSLLITDVRILPIS